MFRLDSRTVSLNDNVTSPAFMLILKATSTGDVTSAVYTVACLAELVVMPEIALPAISETSWLVIDMEVFDELVAKFAICLIAFISSSNKVTVQIVSSPTKLADPVSWYETAEDKDVDRNRICLPSKVAGSIVSENVSVRPSVLTLKSNETTVGDVVSTTWHAPSPCAFKLEIATILFPDMSEIALDARLRYVLLALVAK